MRLFTALRFSKKTITALSAVQNCFKALDAAARYTRPDNFHITLAFIGDVPDSAPAKDALRAACNTYRRHSGRPAVLTFSAPGTFRGGILFLGAVPTPELTALSRAVRTSLQAYAVPFDPKPFRAHLTLARKYKGPLPGLALPEPVTCTHADLVLSHRVENVLTYDTILSVPFITENTP